MSKTLITLLTISAFVAVSAVAQDATDVKYTIGLEHDADVSMAVRGLESHSDPSDEYQDPRLEDAVKRLVAALRQGKLLPALVVVVIEWPGAGSKLESKTVFAQSILELDRLVSGLKESAPGPELEPPTGE